MLKDPQVRRRSSLQVAGLTDPAINISKVPSSPHKEHKKITQANYIEETSPAPFSHDNRDTPSTHHDKAGPSGQQAQLILRNSLHPTTNLHPHTSPKGAFQLRNNRNGSVFNLQNNPPLSKKEVELEDLIKEFKIRRNESKQMEKAQAAVPVAPAPPGTLLGEDILFLKPPQDTRRREGRNSTYPQMSRWIPEPILNLFARPTPRSSHYSPSYSSRTTSIASAAMYRTTSVDPSRYEWSRRSAARNERMLRKLNSNFFHTTSQEQSTSVDSRKSHVRFCSAPSIKESHVFISPRPKRWEWMVCCRKCKTEDKPPPIVRGSILKKSTSNEGS